ncbi:MAG TPA: acyltransferase [Acidobacteriaceae bacterium]|nr:acyltransferase [Acidobacteriaceae bacterium]
MPAVANPQPLEHLRSPHGVASVHLDALRGIAAIGVCLSHVRDLFFRDYSVLPHHSPLLALLYLATGLGHQWVIIFFVLSGYLVGGSVLRAHATGRWKWSGYLFNRLTRLYIVLLPALIFGGLIDVLGLHFFGTHSVYAGTSGSHAIAFTVGDRLSLPILLGNYTFLQTILVPTLGSNGPLWSLSNEFWYYITFPALVMAILPRIALPRRLFYLLLLVAVVLFVKPAIALLGFVWLMGVAIHYLPRIPDKTAFARRAIVIAALALFAVTLAWCKWADAPISDYVLGLVVMLLIYVIIGCSRTPMPEAYNRTARRISHSSYTLYLVHLPLVVILAAYAQAVFHQLRWLPDAPHLLIGGGIFVIAMLYAQLVWFLFEKHTDALRARLRSRLKLTP